MKQLEKNLIVDFHNMSTGAIEKYLQFSHVRRTMLCGLLLFQTLWLCEPEHITYEAVMP